jgi:hypothetical protein
MDLVGILVERRGWVEAVESVLGQSSLELK